MEGIPLIAMMIPIVAITLGVGAIVTLIITLHRAKIRELDQRHKERMAAIEKGLDPYAAAPPDTRASDTSAPARVDRPDGPQARFLLRALTWLGVGLAVALSSEASGVRFSAFVGWIAAAVGGAQVAYYFIEGRRQAVPPAAPREQPPGTDKGS
jgi:hypothetical protein